MHADRHRLNEVSEKIIGCAFQAHNPLVIELRKAELKIAQQSPIGLNY